MKNEVKGVKDEGEGLGVGGVRERGGEGRGWGGV